MVENMIETILPTVIALLELMGICVVSFSAARAFWDYLRAFFLHRASDYKAQLANGLATSLEFKMAAEILKTVIVRELRELLILGVVIAIRAFLSVLIHFELREEHSRAQQREKPADEKSA